MKPKLLYVAPLRDFSGYASVARNYVKALHSAEMDIVTRDLTYDGGKYKRNKIEEELAGRSVQDIDIVLMNTTPNELEYKPGVFNINAFCWETDRVPDEWVHMLNQMDLILVPILDNKLAAQRCGVIKPIEVVPYACDLVKYQKDIKPYEFPGMNDKFKFLNISQYSKKKSIDVLLKAYFTEFSKEDNVVLILKTYIGPNDGDEERARIMSIVNAMKSILRLKDYPPVKLIHQIMSHTEIERLYVTSDIYLGPSRGEGWGVPHLEALCWGLPIIATKGTGPEAFINDNCGWLVESNASPVCDMPHPHNYMYSGLDNWREPHVCDLKDKMRHVYSLYNHTDNYEWKEYCDAAKARAADFSYKIIGPQLNDVIMKYYNMWRTSNAS